MRFFKHSTFVIIICTVVFVTGCSGKNPESSQVFTEIINEQPKQAESINISSLHNDEAALPADTSIQVIETVEPVNEELPPDNIIPIDIAEQREKEDIIISDLVITEITEDIPQAVEITVGEMVVIPVAEEHTDEADKLAEKEHIDEADKPVVFADAKFESIVRQFLGNHQGDVMQSELSKIKYADIFTNLSFSYLANPSKNEKIVIKMNEEDYPSSFDDVKYFTGLEYLSIPFIPVVDLSFISGMTNLKYLYMYKASLSDLSPLGNLKNMQELNLASCDITDISILSNMTELKKLDLSENSLIHDYSMLGGLANLETLKLSGNQIGNIDFLSNSIQILELDLSKNNIENIMQLSSLVNLKSLNLSKNIITDVSPLSQLINLQKLYLTGNSIVDINQLGDIERFGILKYD